MCSKDRTLEENVEGAEALAYLIETDAELQRIAAISDHIIRTLGDYLKYTDIQQISRTGKKSVSTVIILCIGTPKNNYFFSCPNTYKPLK